MKFVFYKCGGSFDNVETPVNKDREPCTKSWLHHNLGEGI